jgi:hypothetical protein
LAEIKVLFIFLGGVEVVEKLDYDLMNIREKMRQRQKNLNRLEQLRSSIQTHASRLYDLEYKMNLEKADVEELEGLSLTSLIAALLRNKEDKLKKEKDEYILARLRYEECLALIETLKSEKSSLESELSLLGNLDAAYECILNRKEQLILKSNNNYKLKLIELTEELSEARSDYKEVEEAINAGNQVVLDINKLLKNLNSANSWGTWDMLGGGFIATSIKHDYINLAKEDAYNLNNRMAAFKRELSDIDFDSNIEIDISSFEVFGDYFFDGFFIDWIVQNKIEDSYGSARKLLEKVGVAMEGLESSLKYKEQIISKLDYKRRRLIEQELR